MEGERGDDMRRSSLRWGELAKQAVSKEGSSDRNIDEFARELV